MLHKRIDRGEFPTLSVSLGVLRSYIQVQNPNLLTALNAAKLNHLRLQNLLKCWKDNFKSIWLWLNRYIQFQIEILKQDGSQEILKYISKLLNDPYKDSSKLPLLEGLRAPLDLLSVKIISWKITLYFWIPTALKFQIEV